MRKIKQILTLSFFILLTSACNTSSTPPPKTAEQLKQELKIKEESTPTNYLTIDGRLQENVTQESGFLRSRKTDGYILSGTIKNSASIAKFKDAVIIVSYLSETRTAMDTKEYILYKYFNPNSEVAYEYKVNPPEGFKNFSIEIRGATATD